MTLNLTHSFESPKVDRKNTDSKVNNFNEFSNPQPSAKVFNKYTIRGSLCILRETATDLDLEDIVTTYPHLTKLDISLCNHITHKGFSHVGKLKKLQSIYILKCKNINDKWLASLTRLNKLISLKIFGCKGISDAGCSYISRIKRLQLLHLGQYYNLTDEGLKSLRALKKLKNFGLSYCPNITDKGLSFLKSSNLRHIDFFICKQLTKTVIAELDKALVNRRINRNSYWAM